MQRMHAFRHREPTVRHSHTQTAHQGNKSWSAQLMALDTTHWQATPTQIHGMLDMHRVGMLEVASERVYVIWVPLTNYK